MKKSTPCFKELDWGFSLISPSKEESLPSSSNSFILSNEPKLFFLTGLISSFSLIEEREFNWTSFFEKISFIKKFVFTIIPLYFFILSFINLINSIISLIVIIPIKFL